MSTVESAARTEPLRPEGLTDAALRPMRFDGERRLALPLLIEVRSPAGRQPEGQMIEGEADLDRAQDALARAEAEGAALAYGFVSPPLADRACEALGLTSLGDIPELVRPLRLGIGIDLPLLLPFGRSRRPGVREITVREPRVTRLWDRFSIDILAALERTARWMDPHVFERPGRTERVFVFEDGDRYVIRALCIFEVDPTTGRGAVLELLHDRSVAGMRAASHLLGLALREMSDGGAREAIAWSLPHSGTFPLFLRHAFVPRPSRTLRFGVRALDPAVAPLVEAREHWYLSLLDRTPR
jgi:hypothetical protein